MLDSKALITKWVINILLKFVNVVENIHYAIDIIIILLNSFRVHLRSCEG